MLYIICSKYYLYWKIYCTNIYWNILLKDYSLINGKIYNLFNKKLSFYKYKYEIKNTQNSLWISQLYSVYLAYMHNSCCTKLTRGIKSRGKKTAWFSLFSFSNSASYRRHYQSSQSADGLIFGRCSTAYARSNYIIVSPENHPRSLMLATGAYGEHGRNDGVLSFPRAVDRSYTTPPSTLPPPRNARARARARVSLYRQPDKGASKWG